MKKVFHVVDHFGAKHRIRPKKVEDFSSMIAGGSCNLYRLFLCSVDGEGSMNLCVKKAQEHLFENLTTSKTVEHQIAIFNYLKEHNIPTYTDMWINSEKQIAIVPFVGDEKKHLCFSGNNRSEAKRFLVEEYNGLTWKDISNISDFGSQMRQLLATMRDNGVRAHDDAFFFDYNADGGVLRVWIGDFHDITKDDDAIKGNDYWHNHNQLEHALRCLRDDRVIDDGLFHEFVNQLYELYDY